MTGGIDKAAQKTCGIELYTSVQTSLGVHFVSSVCSFPAISTVLLPTIHEVNSYIAVHSDVMGLLMLVANGTLPT